MGSPLELRMPPRKVINNGWPWCRILGTLHISPLTGKLIEEIPCFFNTTAFDVLLSGTEE